MSTRNNELVYNIDAFNGALQLRSTFFLNATNELRLLVNGDPSVRIGGITKSKGYDQLGAAINSAAEVLGCGAINFSSGTNKIIAFSGTDGFIWNSGTDDWDAQSLSFTAAQDYYTERFLDQLFLVNGLTDAPRNYNGSNWSTTRNLPDGIKARYIIQEGGFLYLLNISLAVGGSFPSRVWFSDPPKNNTITWGFESGSDLSQTASSGVITSAGATFITNNIKVGDPFFITSGSNAGEYTVKSIDSQTQITLEETLTNTQSNSSYWVGGNYFDVDRDNGDVLKAGGKNSDRLLCFKRNSLHRFTKTINDTANTLVTVKGAPGTVTQRSVVNIGNYTFYYADSGIWRYNGQDSELISDVIQDVIDGISADNFANIVGWQVNDRVLKMYVGDVVNTDENIEIDECVICHDIFTGQWWTQSFFDAITCATDWVYNGKKEVFLFTTEGLCLLDNNTSSFNATEIAMEIETVPHFPISPDVAVGFTRFRVQGRRLRDVQALVKLYYLGEDGRTGEDWIPLAIVDNVTSSTEMEFRFPNDFDVQQAAGFAVKLLHSSGNMNPVIERIAAYYTPGRLR